MNACNQDKFISLPLESELEAVDFEMALDVEEQVWFTTPLHSGGINYPERDMANMFSKSNGWIRPGFRGTKRERRMENTSISSSLSR